MIVPSVVWRYLSRRFGTAAIEAAASRRSVSNISSVSLASLLASSTYDHDLRLRLDGVGHVG